jgi:protein phosphatase
VSDFDIEWAAQSDVGRMREANEDSFLADDYGGLWVVADGMGGHQGGETASLLVCQCIHEFLVDHASDDEFRERYEVASNLPPEARILGAAIRYANERVFIEAMKDPGLDGMGSTVVAILRHEDNLVLAHVGDSRIYRFRDKLLQQITSDHSLVNHLLMTGQITPDQVRGYPKGNVILRAMGLKDEVDVDVQMQPMVDGDIYALCSDGLSDMVEDAVIEQILRESNGVLAQAAQQLVMLANANGGKDNITICLLLVNGLPEQPTVTL